MKRRRFLAPCLLLAVAAWTSPATPAEDDIYNEKADAAADIHAAIGEAGRDHRNIVLVFGANWCGPCRSLDRQMHLPEMIPLMKKFVVVKIDTGEETRRDLNADIRAKYRVPGPGIPAIAILGPSGEPLYGAEVDFPNRKALMAFFDQWSPKK